MFSNTSCTSLSVAAYIVCVCKSGYKTVIELKTKYLRGGGGVMRT